MQEEDVQAELENLTGQLEACDDPRQGYALVNETIERHQQAGETVPSELHQLRRAIEVECTQMSQGR
ncbi:MAG: hypothetical protein AAGG72_02315 [Pseudomonadota bacterium]